MKFYSMGLLLVSEPAALEGALQPTRSQWRATAMM